MRIGGSPALAAAAAMVSTVKVGGVLSEGHPSPAIQSWTSPMTEKIALTTVGDVGVEAKLVGRSWQGQGMFGGGGVFSSQ